MKKICFLSISCLLLSGCFGSTDDYDMYTQNNLRAPARPPIETKSESKTVRKTTELPQSITQPSVANISPVNSAIAPQTTPQQPLVQTIVIPQYAPTPAVYPYAQPTAYGTTAMPYGALPQLTVPAQSTMLGGMSGGIPQIQNPAPIPQNTTPAIPKPKVKKETVTVVSQPKEAVYPSWAASDYIPPVTTTSTDTMVTFKNPHRDETVQCAAIDVMCIASYQQQGYKRVLPHKTGLEDEDTQGYPKTKWKTDNSIPRW